MIYLSTFLIDWFVSFLQNLYTSADTILVFDELLRLGINVPHASYPSRIAEVTSNVLSIITVTDMLPTPEFKAEMDRLQLLPAISETYANCAETASLC